MAKLYEIKPSAGRGNGVFATADLQPGATFMSDKVGLRVDEVHGTLEHEDVQTAFDKLPAQDQKRFLELHEGHRPLPTRLLRIVKANCFGDHDDSSPSLVVFLEISRINHSCVPNAEVAQWDDEARVMALKPISRGEEVFISYQDEFHGMTKRQRAGVLKAYFGFTCNCRACTLPPNMEDISDCRRRLANVLSYQLNGYKVPDMLQEVMLHLSAEELERPTVRNAMATRLLALETPLTDQEKVAYNIMLAGLLEAEDIAGMSLALCYKHAAITLANQILGTPSIVLLPSVRILEAWSQKAADAMEVARSTGSTEVTEIRELRASMHQSVPIAAAHQIFRDPAMSSVYAAHVGDVVRGGLGMTLYTEEQYKDSIRRGERIGRTAEEYDENLRQAGR